MKAATVGKKRFFGWRAVYGAFVVAFFSWGLCFYGPPIYLQVIHERRGWPIPLIAAAITTHYLVGAVFITRLPWMYRRFSLAKVTAAGSVFMLVGCCGWAAAASPMMLFTATLFTGLGWAVTGGAAINAIVTPWFIRLRPRALSFAYNGASVGGLVFSPLLVFSIKTFGFFTAVLVLGVTAVVSIGYFVAFVFSHTPAEFGLNADGDLSAQHTAPGTTNPVLPGNALWRDLKFYTLSVGASLGLFAQIGLLAHAFSVSVPMMGATNSGFLLSATAFMAVLGRSVVGAALSDTIDRRLVAIANYGLQMLGGILLIVSAGRSPALVVVGMLLFGFGVGNANLLPPLIVQTEFSQQDVLRVVALVTAISQAVYAFAPALFGVARGFAHPGSLITSEVVAIGVVAVIIQSLAMGALFLGRIPRRHAFLPCDVSTT
jgi:MFS family permease